MDQYVTAFADILISLTQPVCPKNSKSLHPETIIKNLRNSTPFVFAGFATIGVIFLFWPTTQSILQIWSVSETFTHGYFVIPVFLWLVWRQRKELLTTASRPDLRVLLFTAMAGAMWLLSRLAGIQVGEQLALALILVSTIWAVVGEQIASQLKFPLVFLLFLAPVGEELVPVLMEVTADMTVWAIRNTGIPIYREGLFFSLPSGNWSVVEACSGVRYLIASAFLGSLYAYLSFTSFKLRLSFFIVSLIVPIIANSVRAYIIVMLGHFSGNKLATGVDHLIYGWVFFGIVMFALFSIGAWLTRFDNEILKVENDAEQDTEANAACTPARSVDQRQSISKYASAMVVIFAVVAAWPAWSKVIDTRSADDILAELESSKLLPDGQIIAPDENIESTAARWQPHNSGHDKQLSALYTRANLPDIRALAFVYTQQRQGKEMINSSNVLARSRNDVWRISGVESKKVPLENSSIADLKEYQLNSGSRRLVVWQWYRVGDATTSNALHVKLLEMRDKLVLKKSLSTNYMLAVDGNAKDNIDALEAALNRVMN